MSFATAIIFPSAVIHRVIISELIRYLAWMSRCSSLIYSAYFKYTYKFRLIYFCLNVPPVQLIWVEILEGYWFILNHNRLSPSRYNNIKLFQVHAATTLQVFLGRLHFSRFFFRDFWVPPAILQMREWKEAISIS